MEQGGGFVGEDRGGFVAHGELDEKRLRRHDGHEDDAQHAHDQIGAGVAEAQAAVGAAGGGHDFRAGRLAGGEDFAQRIASGKGGRDGHGAGGAVFRVLFQALEDDALDDRIDVFQHLAGRRGVFGTVQLLVVAQRGALERAAPGEHFIEEQAQRIDVGADGDALAGELLGGHVGGRAGADGVFGHLVAGDGEAEIGDAHGSAAVDHDVGGLEVAVEDAAVVGRGEAGAELAGDLQGLILGEPADAPQEAGEVFAVDVFHGDELLALEFADVEDAADVWMGDLAGEADLRAEAFEPFFVGGKEGGEELEGDGLVEGHVVGAIDLAHAAAAEQFDDAVSSGDDGAGHEAAGVDEAGARVGPGGGIIGEVPGGLAALAIVPLACGGLCATGPAAGAAFSCPPSSSWRGRAGSSSNRRGSRARWEGSAFLADVRAAGLRPRASLPHRRRRTGRRNRPADRRAFGTRRERFP